MTKCLRLTTWSAKSIKYTLFYAGLFASPAWTQDLSQADQADFFDDLELNFNESSEQPETKDWYVKGSIAEDVEYGLFAPEKNTNFSRDSAGITQIRTTARLGVQGKLLDRIVFAANVSGFYDAHYHQNASDFSAEEFDALADEIELRDTFIEFETLDNLWLKIGNQIIAWGESEFVQIADVINPRDEREFGLVDLEDSRLPLLSSRISYTGKRWGVDAVFLQEHKSDKYAGEGADFDPLIQARGQITIASTDNPDVGITNPDFVGRIFSSYALGDISIIAGKTHAKQESLRFTSQPNLVQAYYPEIKTLGIAGNFINGFWLWKGELAYKTGAEFAANGISDLFIEKDLIQGLAGVEYAGYQDTQLTFELQADKIQDYEDFLQQREFQSLLSARINFEFMRDTANLEFVLAAWLEDNSQSLRVTYQYDITDSLKYKAGFISFFAGSDDALLKSYEHNDRLFTGLTYSF